MDVTLPMSSVIPSVEGSVFQALSRSTEPMSLSQVHRLIDGWSMSGVRKSLVNLVDTGIVLASGSPPRYALNRGHLAFPAIEHLASMRALLFERIRDLVADWESGAELVGMFGSMARQTGDSGSDIDLLVVATPSEDEVVGLVESVQRWTGNETNVVVLSVDEYEQVLRSGDAIATEWSRDLIVLYRNGRVDF
jgi:predicted nucleotidyltransferase